MLRVFLLTTSQATDTPAREKRLKDILHILRIKASIINVSWDDVQSRYAVNDGAADPKHPDIGDLSSGYLQS